MTRFKLRKLELLAGAERRQGRHDHPDIDTYHHTEQRILERELSTQAEQAYRRIVADWKATGPHRTQTGPAMT